jgi:hypothetical protein
MPRKSKSAGLPSRKEILDFIASSDQPAGKREIARAFGLKGQDKVQLKALLRDMADEGLIDSAPGRAFHKAGGVPKVTVLRVVEADDSGNIWAVPEHWEAEVPAPKLRVIERGKRSALGIGDRILSRTEETRAGLRRPSDEEAGANGRAGPRRHSQGRRPLLADPGREEGTARASRQRPQGRGPATWCCAKCRAAGRG